ncbi:hypothetical protein HOD38_01665 [archaeon]|jgi:hypothetical protein|nr:hypothetical protein [archaeon]MBT4396952.1 hypothetical protein [archaeon]MBT4440943.1 hypothetical protein [archaeon]
MDLCIGETLGLFFVILIFFVKNWGWTLSFIVTAAVIVFLLKKFRFILGFLVDVLDALTDLVGDALFETVIGLIGFMIIGAILVGILWVAILWSSEANWILKIVATPFFLVVGAIIGAIPIPLPGLTTAIAWGLGDENYANIACFAPVVVLVLLAGLNLIFPAIILWLTGVGLCDMISALVEVLT